MYETFFNLTSKPFELVPNPEFLFLSRSHKRALTYLDYGLRERAGFILLTGEIGAGKTTIIRNLIKNRDQRMVLSKVFNTRVDSTQLITLINDDFGLATQGKDRITLLRDLNDFLIAQYAKGTWPVLIIDEAQNLTPELLEEVRLLSNLETDSAKLLQIILVGQPELRKVLAAPELIQLRQRMSIHCHISPLSRVETEQYILHRLEKAGDRDAVSFSPEAVDTIYRYSKGIPRLINIICDFLMLSAFAEETTEISGEMVREIIGDLDFENQYWATYPQPAEEARHSAPEDSFTQTAAPELVSLLREMKSRLDALERDLAGFSRPAREELAEKISSLENAFRFHVGETDNSLTELRKTVEKTRDVNSNGSGVQSAGVTLASNSGLLRRIFGG